jgi:hypothetical protein
MEPEKFADEIARRLQEVVPAGVFVEAEAGDLATSTRGRSHAYWGGGGSGSFVRQFFTFLDEGRYGTKTRCSSKRRSMP